MSAFDPKQTFQAGILLIQARSCLSPGRAAPIGELYVLCPASQREARQYCKSASVEGKLMVHRVFGSECPQCGAGVIAPEWS